MNKAAIRLSLAAATLWCASAHAGEWKQREHTDPMTDVSSTQAIIISDNRVPLETPRGSTSASLYFSLNRGELVAGIGVIDGIIDCPRTGSCQIEIRVAGEPVQTHSAVVAGTRYQTAFFKDPQQVLQQLQSARRISVRLPLFREGRQIFEFTPETDVPAAVRMSP